MAPMVVARQAVWAGAFGGAVVGYLGGGPLELGKLGNEMLIAAGLGAVIGSVVAAWLSFGSGHRDWVFWLFVPAIAAGAALLVGLKEAFDWALGWAVAQQAKGVAAAALGAVLGGLLAAGIAYVAARHRVRAYNQQLQRIEEIREMR